MEVVSSIFTPLNVGFWLLFSLVEARIEGTSDDSLHSDLGVYYFLFMLPFHR